LSGISRGRFSTISELNAFGKAPPGAFSGMHERRLRVTWVVITAFGTSEGACILPGLAGSFPSLNSRDSLPQLVHVGQPANRLSVPLGGEAFSRIKPRFIRDSSASTRAESSHYSGARKSRSSLPVSSIAPINPSYQRWYCTNEALGFDMHGVPAFHRMASSTQPITLS
jgi:hypothetical protein